MKFIWITLFLLLCSFLITNTYSQQNVDSIAVNSDDCECLVTDQKRSGRYMPPIEVLLEYEEFMKHNGWWYFKDSIRDYNKIYFVDTQIINGHGDFLYLFNVFIKPPLKLISRSNTFTLNLTPCETLNNCYLKHFSVSGNQKNYEFENFDYSATAFFNYFTRGDRGSISVLENILYEFSMWEDGDNEIYFEKIDELINKINTKYGITLNISEDDDVTSSFINAVEAECIRGNMNLSEFIIHEYVVEDTTSHIITPEEEDRLRSILRKDMRGTSVEWVSKVSLSSNYGASLETDRVGVEFSTDIIRKWDNENNMPAKDSLGSFMNSRIILNVDEVGFDLLKSVELNIKDVCTTTSEISNTGILFHFDEATFIAPELKIKPNFIYSPVLDFKKYPLFKKDNSQNNIDTLINNFTGLSISQSDMQIPFGGKTLNIIGKDIIINNFLISGIFEIPFESGGKTDIVKIGDLGSKVVTSLTALENHLLMLGLDKVKIDKQEEKILVYFKKAELSL